MAALASRGAVLGRRYCLPNHGL